MLVHCAECPVTDAEHSIVTFVGIANQTDNTSTADDINVSSQNQSQSVNETMQENNPHIIENGADSVSTNDSAVPMLANETLERKDYLNGTATFDNDTHSVIVNESAETNIPVVNEILNISEGNPTVSMKQSTQSADVATQMVKSSVSLATSTSSPFTKITTMFQTIASYNTENAQVNGTNATTNESTNSTNIDTNTTSIEQHSPQSPGPVTVTDSQSTTTHWQRLVSHLSTGINCSGSFIYSPEKFSFVLYDITLYKKYLNL